ncbi:MAG: hypothetical protein EBZ36_17795 [Acidobacteria bacterium]|nr:hypothetical protein [Acidobacteriota bacterium]
MADIVVPVLGESVREATVGTWLKSAGQTVAKDEALVELETDKVSVEVAAGEDGVLSEVLKTSGETVEIGAVLGRITPAGGASLPGANPDRQAQTRGAVQAASQKTEAGDTMDIKVPVMGESVTEGTLANWLVKPGQAVAQDDPIAEIETDKVAIEVPAPAAGVVSELIVKAGETVAIGTVIARMTTGAAPAKSPTAAPTPSAPVTAPPAKAASTDKVAPSVLRVACSLLKEDKRKPIASPLYVPWLRAFPIPKTVLRHTANPSDLMADSEASRSSVREEVVTSEEAEMLHRKIMLFTRDLTF